MPGDAKSIFHLIDEADIEGMVSKRRDSKHRSGRSTNWLKIKTYAVEECDLLGVEREMGKHAFALKADRAMGKYVGSAFINPAVPSASGCGSASRTLPGRRRRA